MKRVFGAAFTMAATVAVGLSWATIGNAACGKVSIAEMNWASAELMANVDKIILEKGYGCEVELVAGATMPTFTSMNEKGAPDVAPELWANAVVEPLTKATSEGRLIVANKAPITGLVKVGGCHQQLLKNCLLYTSPSPRDSDSSRMPSSA